MAFAPLPPRRPAPQPIVVASADPMVLPVVEVAAPPASGAGPQARQLDRAQGSRERPVRLRAPPSLDLTFAPHLPGDLTITRFSGPAVKPLPVLRQASL